MHRTSVAKTATLNSVSIIFPFIETRLPFEGFICSRERYSRWLVAPVTIITVWRFLIDCPTSGSGQGCALSHTLAGCLSLAGIDPTCYALTLKDKFPENCYGSVG